MALKPAVQGSTADGLRISWTRADGTSPDLRNTVISARIRNLRTGIARAADGLFESDPDNPAEFLWTFGINDVSEAGQFEVQFIADDAGKQRVTFPELWEVHARL